MDQTRDGAAPSAGGTPRVLIPGAEQWGLRVGELLAARGLDVELVPHVDVAPPTDLTCLDSALNALARGDYDWIVVTSPTTVLSLSARVATLANRGRDTPSSALGTFVGDTGVATLGPGCARALERSGVLATLVPPAGRSGAALLALFPPAPEASDARGHLGRAGRVLVTRSDLAGGGLAAALTGLGWQVDDLVVYRTLTGTQDGPALRLAAHHGGFAAVLLGAPSAVDALVELVGEPPEGTVIGCLGPRTAVTAREQGLRVDVAPPEATAEALVSAVVDALTPRVTSAAITDLASRDERYP